MREFKFEYLISYGLLFLAILYIVTGSKKTKNKTYLMFCFYLTVIGIIDATAGTLAFLKKYNLFLSHFYFVAEFITLSFFFRKLLMLKQRKFVNALIGVVSFVLLILFIISGLDYYELKPLNPFQIIICALPILIFTVMHLYNSMINEIRFVFVSVGVLFYKTLSVVIFMVLNFANTKEFVGSFSSMLWDLNQICLLIYMGLIFTEWFKNYRVKKSS